MMEHALIYAKAYGKLSASVAMYLSGVMTKDEFIAAMIENVGESEIDFDALHNKTTIVIAD